MKKLKVSMAAAIMSVLMASSAFAGTWSHTYTDKDGQSYTYSSLWLYEKDDDTYAQSEWIQDTDGIWYWVESDGSLPISAGISDNGYLFDEDGRYIPRNNCSSLTVEQAAAITVDMTYEQVLAILGPKHVRTDDRIIFNNDNISSYAVCIWYFDGGHGRYRLEFNNGVVTDIYDYFH